MRPASETITASSVSQPRSPSGRGSRLYLCSNRGRSPEHFEEGAGHPSGPAAGPAEVPAKVTNPRLSTFVSVPRSALPDGPWLRSGGHLSPRSKASAKNQLWGRVGGGGSLSEEPRSPKGRKVASSQSRGTKMLRTPVSASRASALSPESMGSGSSSPCGLAMAQLGSARPRRPWTSRMLGWCRGGRPAVHRQLRGRVGGVPAQKGHHNRLVDPSDTCFLQNSAGRGSPCFVF